MTTPPEQCPRRRDLRNQPVNPLTGQITAPAKAAKPAGDPLPARRDLRTGRIQIVPPAPGQPSSATKYVRVGPPPSHDDVVAALAARDAATRGTTATANQRKTMPRPLLWSAVGLIAVIAAAVWMFVLPS